MIPKNIKYTRGNVDWDGITLFTESCIFDGSVDRVNSPIKIAWLMEPPAISNHLYINLPDVIQKFDYVRWIMLAVTIYFEYKFIIFF